MPTLIVSPWTAGGRVCGDAFDHTSVLRFLELVTGVECTNISAYRRAFIGDLTTAFDFESAPPDHPPAYSSPYPLPEPPADGWSAPNTDNPDSPTMNTLTAFTPASFEVTRIPAGPFTLPAVLPPGLASFQGMLYAAWKGEAGDDRLFYSSLTDGAWQPAAAIPGNSSAGVGLADWNGSLWAAWKGEFTDQRLFLSSFDGATWSQVRTIPGNSSMGPSLAVFDGQLYACWKGEIPDLYRFFHGELSDQRLFFSVLAAPGGEWSPVSAIPGNSSIGPALAAFGKDLVAVWKGELLDQRIFTGTFDGQSWVFGGILPGNTSPDWE